MNRRQTLRSSRRRSSVLGILTLMAVFLLAPCLHAQEADVVGPHSPASHATDREPCCFDSSPHRFTESHPPCAVVGTIARSVSDRDTVQPVPTAVVVPVPLDSDHVESQWTRRFHEERGMKVQSLSLYTLHRQYRL